MKITEADRIKEVYVEMAHAGYRPAAPGDGVGNINLTAQELKSKSVLDSESNDYARRFIDEEDSRKFWIGCSNWESNRAIVYTIEAARCMCGAQETLARKLLLLALKEIDSR